MTILTRLEYINDFIAEYGNEIDSWFIADINEIKKLIIDEYDNDWIMIKIDHARDKNRSDGKFIHPQLEIFYKHLVNLNN